MMAHFRRTKLSMGIPLSNDDGARVSERPRWTWRFAWRTKALFAIGVLLVGAATACADGTDAPDASSTPDYTECPDSRCSDRGVCSVLELRPFCACDVGYAGAVCGRCDDGFHRDASDDCVADEECTDERCGPNGSCSERGGTAICECAPGFAGARCDGCAAGFHEDGDGCALDVQCLANTCSGRGACSVVSGAVQCDCETNFSGPFCEVDDTPAESCADANPCGANGTCSDSSGRVTCLCDAGYVGATCEECYPGYVATDDGCEFVPSCPASTCFNAGTCTFVDGQAQCACDVGYAGALCDRCEDGYHRDSNFSCVENTTCAEDNPCLGSGTCVDDGGAARCACDPGYAGEACDECYPGYHQDASSNCVVDAFCRTATCGEGGECDDDGGVVACTCAPGFEGTYCQTNIDDCVNHACGSGECIDLTDGRTCHCLDGTYGESCPK